MIKAVIWDMDGVMVDSEILWAKMEQEFFKRHGIPYSLELEANFIGKTQTEVIAWIKQQFALSAPVEVLLSERIELLKEIFRQTLTPNSGLTEAIRYCQGQGWQLAVASASPRAVVEFVLEHTHVREYFPVVVSGDELTHGKPDPESFLRAAEQLKVAPRFCVVIEDSPRGLSAAKAARMRCIVMPDQHFSRHDQFVDADILVKTLYEIPSALQQLEQLV